MFFIPAVVKKCHSVNMTFSGDKKTVKKLDMQLTRGKGKRQ